ncbi:MAG: response regulator [Bacteroidota bacterium]|nr:response regulator [Bacteroidota bacterium]
MKKILVVDDIAENRVLVSTVLQKRLPGNEVFMASTGPQALEIALEKGPDVILLDVFMPGMDGFEVCKRLKESEETRNIPVLMISAYGNDAKIRIEGLNVGADAFLTKPFNQAELVALVKVLLRIKEAEEKLREQNMRLSHEVRAQLELNKQREEHLKQIRKYQNRLKQLNLALIMAEENERKRIAGYIHDGFGQQLSIVFLKLSMLQNVDLEPRARKIIDESSGLINEAIKASRSLTHDLSPSILFELGLVAAIKWKLSQMQEEFGVRARMKSDLESIDLSHEMKILLYRIICELLNNVVKHAEASEVAVELNKYEESLYIAVKDNGKGFDYDRDKNLTEFGGYGLFSITEKLDSMNGKLHVQSGQNAGSVVKILIPLKDQ